MAGRKPEAFSSAQNAVLRREFQALRERHNWSLTAAGKAVGIGQQAAGKILNGGGGFAYPTAMKLAQICGFNQPEDMFRDAGVTAPDAKDAPTTAKEGRTWGVRDGAVLVALRPGAYSRVAVDRVIARYVDNVYSYKDLRFWMDRFSAEQIAVDEEAKTVAEAAAAGHDAAALPRARRKRAALKGPSEAPPATRKRGQG